MEDFRPACNFTESVLATCLGYARHFKFEDLDDGYDDGAFYYPGEEVKPNTVKNMKKFLRQVRDSEGYDVDVIPPLFLMSPFNPLTDVWMNDDYLRSLVAKMVDITIWDMKASVELVEVKKLVHAVPNSTYLLTFTAKVEDISKTVTVRAMAHVPIGDNLDLLTLQEWKVEKSEKVED